MIPVISGLRGDCSEEAAAVGSSRSTLRQRGLGAQNPGADTESRQRVGQETSDDAGALNTMLLYHPFNMLSIYLVEALL